MSTFKRFFPLFFFAGLSIFYSCGNQSGGACSDEIKHYIHVGHTRMMDTVTQVVDPRIEQIKYDQFDMVLLGGDLCEESSKRYDILEYLDGVFDLDSPNTLWALGNHDNARMDFVEKATGRPYVYSYNKNNITYIVLYTQEKADWRCEITGNQMDLIRAVTDTISESSHLIVMTHKLIWLWENKEMAEHQGKVKYDWSCNYKVYRNGWKSEIVPLLHKVMDRDIQVIALAGDVGNYVSEFEERTSDGIYYLASGNNPDNKKAKFLHFKHHVPTGMLTWEFEPLEAFLKNGQVLN